MDVNKKESSNPLFEDAISVYTQDEAIDDGVLVWVGLMGKERMVFTRNLFDDGYQDEVKRHALIQCGIEMLCLENAEDCPEMRLRVIEKGKIWVIWHVGEGFTFLKPEDY